MRENNGSGLLAGVIRRRWIIWPLLVIAGGYWMYSIEVANSQAAYEAGDGSAFAWRGFLLFIWPLFLVKPVAVVLPLSIATEVVLWWRRRRSKES